MARRKSAPSPKPRVETVTEKAQVVHWWVVAVVGGVFLLLATGWRVHEYTDDYAKTADLAKVGARVDWLVDREVERLDRSGVTYPPPPKKDADGK